jgi:hypothetical protein
MWAGLAGLGVAMAASVVQPEVLLHQQLISQGKLDALAGSSDHGERARTEALDRSPELEAWQLPWIEGNLRPWHSLNSAWPTWSAQSWVRTAVGAADPVGLLGDTEPGRFSQRVGGRLQVQNPWIELRLAPEFALDLIEVNAVDLVAFEAWAAGHWRGWSLGFGARERTLGPGHHGSLVIGDGAQPWPAGEVSWEARLPVLGRLRAETSIGWLPGERQDVLRPGVLHMDFRWAPVPCFELGASRLSLFGGTSLNGERRPLPSVSQLLFPDDPHVYDDPDLLLPDQDELAALDARVVLPLDRWVPGPVDAIEVWYQYGGEDVILRSIGPIPVPALAGVANLYGAQVSGDRWWVLAERAVLMDDLFRWYVGHRIYHEGFTRDGQSLGHVNGGDQATLWLEAGWTPMPWGGSLWVEQLRRVGAIEKSGTGSVLTLMTEEHRWRAGAQAWKMRADGGHLGLGAELVRTTGRDFVPESDDWGVRVWLEWRTAAIWGRTGPPWLDPSAGQVRAATP